MQGQGVAVVRATGINTEIGKIGKALQKVTSEKTALQKETNLLVRNLAILGLSLCLMVVIVYGMTRRLAAGTSGRHNYGHGRAA